MNETQALFAAFAAQIAAARTAADLDQIVASFRAMMPDQRTIADDAARASALQALLRLEELVRLRAGTLVAVANHEAQALGRLAGDGRSYRW